MNTTYVEFSRAKYQRKHKSKTISTSQRRLKASIKMNNYLKFRAKGGNIFKTFVDNLKAKITDSHNQREFLTGAVHAITGNTRDGPVNCDLNFNFSNAANIDQILRSSPELTGQELCYHYSAAVNVASYHQEVGGMRSHAWECDTGIDRIHEAKAAGHIEEALRASFDFKITNNFSKDDKEAYIKACEYFRKNYPNCPRDTPMALPMANLKDTLAQLGESVGKVVKCLFKELTGEAVASIFANIATFGIYGLVKTIIDLIQFGKALYDMYQNLRDPYNLGYVFGKAALVLKSAVGARRRFK